jgi:hypothetical protein
MTLSSESEIENSLFKYLTDESGLRGRNLKLLPRDRDTIKLQLLALKYIESLSGSTRVDGSVVELLVLTEAGKRALLEIKSVRRD